MIPDVKKTKNDLFKEYLSKHNDVPRKLWIEEWYSSKVLNLRLDTSIINKELHDTGRQPTEVHK